MVVLCDAYSPLTAVIAGQDILSAFSLTGSPFSNAAEVQWDAPVALPVRDGKPTRPERGKPPGIN
jgi:hypothetical protein